MRNLKALGLAAALAATATPLLAQHGSEGFQFLKAVRERDASVVQPMVTRPNSAVINHRDSNGEGALHILVRGRDLQWLSFLLARGARVDLQSNDGSTPLALATQLGWFEGAEQLLARRANPNLANRRGETPLILAVRNRDVRLVQLLLSQRADPRQTDNVSGYSAIDYARQDPRAAPILRLLEARRTP